MRVRMYFACYLYVCVRVCVAVYVCMLRVRCNTVCWRRAPRIGQACLHSQSALFANINPAPLEGHTHASKSSQATHLASQARWSRSRCSFPDRTGRLRSRRSQRPRVCLYDCRSFCIVLELFHCKLQSFCTESVLKQNIIHGHRRAFSCPSACTLTA